MVDKEKDELNLNSVDAVVAITKGIFGSVPLIGPAIGEMIGISIPSQRVDRITDVLRRTEQKVDELEEFKKKLETEQGRDLTEDVFNQATRAMTEKRRDCIATMFKNGILKTDANHIQKKKLISILENLNDAEITILKIISDDIGTSENTLTSDETAGFAKRNFNTRYKGMYSNLVLPGDVFLDNYMLTLQRNGLIETTQSDSTFLGSYDLHSTTELGKLFLDYLEILDD